MKKRRNRFGRKTKVATVKMGRRLKTRLYYIKVFFLRYKGLFLTLLSVFFAGILFAVFFLRPTSYEPKVIKPADYAAALEKGTRLYDRHRFKEAYSYLYPVRQAYPQASLLLGKIFYEGKGVKRDTTQAYEYFKSASETEDEAKFMLAKMNFRGEAKGLRKGLTTKMLMESAYAGVVEAQYTLGVFYMLSSEKEQAYFWISLAEKNGFDKAYRLIDSLKNQLSEDEISLLDLEVADFSARK